MPTEHRTEHDHDKNMASFLSTVKRKLSAFLSFGGTSPEEAADVDSDMLYFEDRRPRKRQRHEGTQTPMLQGELSTPHLEPADSILLPPAFTLGHTDVVSSEGTVNKSNETSNLLRLSNDVISRCLSFIATKSDRFALQTTCTTFRRLSDSDEMLANIELGDGWNILQTSTDIFRHPGDINVREMNNNRGIITIDDTSVTACNKLIKYAAAGNIEAVYMLAMILCYCHENISEGLALLRLARDAGHLPSTYALALILRDSRHVESEHCLNIAAEKNYPPAWQEKLSAIEMRSKFGGRDLDASKLIHYLDSPCLIRLLGRHYLECQRVRKNQTSHCWNIHCGRWAYRAVPPLPQRPQDQGGILEPFNANDDATSERSYHDRQRVFSIESLLPQSHTGVHNSSLSSPLQKLRECLENKPHTLGLGSKVSRMKMCSSCRRAKYCR